MSRALETAWTQTVRRHGAARAIVQASDGQACTFQQLDERALAWMRAHGLQAQVLRGYGAVFAAPNGIGWFEIFLGLLRAGAVVVPLDAMEPPGAQRALAATIRAGFIWEGARLTALPKPRRYREAGLSLIKMTSGTTGRPRPLVFHAQELLADARQVMRTMRISPADVNLALIPFGHSYGLGNLTLPLLAQGVPLVCGASSLPQAIAADVTRWQPTILPSVPAVFRALAASELPPQTFANVRRLISAGAPLAVEVARDFLTRFGQPLHNFYGSSETGGIAFDRTGEATLAGGVGRPLLGVTVTALPGQRIRISSAAVFKHGHGRRVGARGAWIPPDEVAKDGRGQLTLLGRRGTMVKVAGRRLNLAEISAKLRQLPGVRDVWLGVGGTSELVVGVAVATERPAPELRAALGLALAAWKVPKKWLTLSQLPVSARGKVDAPALQRRLFGQA